MRRVVVTGLGLLSPFGMGFEHSWRELLSGRSACRRVTEFEARQGPHHDQFATDTGEKAGVFIDESGRLGATLAILEARPDQMATFHVARGNP